MKIDVIAVIQDALIGGTNGDMTFKYNNHFIRGIFDRFEAKDNEIRALRDQGKNYEDAKFYLFVKALIEEEIK